MTTDTIKRRLLRAEKISGERPLALLTDEQLDARIKELSAKGGLPLPDEAIKIYGSLPAYIKVLRESMANGRESGRASAPGDAEGGDVGSSVQARAAS